MSLPCSTDGCNRPSTIFCFDCNKKFCSEHLKEHDESLNTQLYSIANDIKILSTQYALINTNLLLDEFREQLNRWRENSHQTIERLYQNKFEELKRDWPQKLTRPQKDLDKIRARNVELIRREKTSHDDLNQLRDALSYIDQQIKDIEQKGIQIDIRPITIETNQESTPEYRILDIDLIDLSSSYRAIGCSSQSGVAFTGNHRNLLIYENRSLKLLPQDLISSEQSSWTYGHIFDMCWSTILNSFILVTDKKVIFQVNENPLTFKPLQAIPEEKWWSCTSSDQSLFLTTYGTEAYIFQFNLQSAFDKVNYWRSPATCKQHECIQNIKYTNETLALIIADPTNKTARLELRSSVDLNKLWTYQIDIKNISYQPAIHSCLLKDKQWIIIIENTSNIYHINKHGTLISIYQYKPSVWNAVLYAYNILALRTEKKIFFHKM